MAERVTCVVRGDRGKYSDCRCITELRTANGTRLLRLEAHYLVKATPGALYVERRGSRVDVVAAEREGLRYVRTEPNDTDKDNLLQLDEC